MSFKNICESHLIVRDAVAGKVKSMSIRLDVGQHGQDWCSLVTIAIGDRPISFKCFGVDSVQAVSLGIMQLHHEIERLSSSGYVVFLDPHDTEPFDWKTAWGVQDQQSPRSTESE